MGSDITIQIIAFLAVFLFVVSLPQVFRRRAATGGSTAAASRVRLGIIGLLVPQDNALSRMGVLAAYRLFPGLRLHLRRLIGVAGLTGVLQEDAIIGAQAFAGGMGAMFAACCVLVLTMDLRYSLLAAFLAAVFGVLYPNIWLKRRAQERQDAIARDLPFAMDLLTVAIQSGQDFGAALRLLLEAGRRSPLYDEFSQVMDDIQLGKTRVQSLQDMATRIDLDELRNLVAVVSQSIEMGAGLGDVFQLQAEEMRRRRFHLAERKAARAPSLMIIPTALFIMPATFIVILVPIILKLLITVKGL